MVESGARWLLDQLRNEGWTRVERLVSEQEPESEHVEFKTAKSVNNQPLSDADLQAIAAAVSGLANTGGGTIVVGIHTTPKKKRVADRAYAVQAGLNADAMCLRVSQVLASLVEPLPSGIALEVVRRLPGQAEGVLAIHVPASDAGPHRVRATAIYYMRTATNTEPLPHALLADRFGRAAHPHLHLHAAFVRGELTLSIGNTGRGAAEAPAVAVALPKQMTLLQGTWGWSQQMSVDEEGNERRLYLPETGTVLYPGCRVIVGISTCERDWNACELSGALYARDVAPIGFAGQIKVDSTVVLPEGE